MQMAEYGYIAPSQEELVADIGTRYLESSTGIAGAEEWDDEYLQECKAKLKSDRNFIFTASSLAQKALDFILSEETETGVREDMRKLLLRNSKSYCNERRICTRYLAMGSGTHGYPWFDRECYLMQGWEGQDHYDSSYFVPKKRIDELGAEIRRLFE